MLLRTLLAAHAVLPTKHASPLNPAYNAGACLNCTTKPTRWRRGGIGMHWASRCACTSQIRQLQMNKKRNSQKNQCCWTRYPGFPQMFERCQANLPATLILHDQLFYFLPNVDFLLHKLIRHPSDNYICKEYATTTYINTQMTCMIAHSIQRFAQKHKDVLRQ